jgi:hypothetical protein
MRSLLGFVRSRGGARTAIAWCVDCGDQHMTPVATCTDVQSCAAGPYTIEMLHAPSMNLRMLREQSLNAARRRKQA